MAKTSDMAKTAVSCLLLFGATFGVTACEPRAEEPAAHPEPQASTAWTIGVPADAGLDPAALEAVAERIEVGEFPNTHALLIEYDGALVYERYFSGTDERWGESLGDRALDRDDLHDLRSVSKSVTSALLGIALDGDFEVAVAKPVVAYLPGLEVGPEQRQITLHQVLTMTAGLEWNEMSVPYTDPMNDEIRLYDATDPALYVLTRPMSDPPGSAWYYSGGLSQVLASVVHDLTGQSLDEYARLRLFEPLGITDFEWLGPGTWEPDNPAAMSGLRLRARDLAKIGSVFLHGGRWQGRQIVPEAWVDRSMSRFVDEIGDWSDGGIWGYGYQWWVGRLPAGERVVAAVGNGNQRLFILPDLKMVVTVLAGEYNKFAGHSERLLDQVLAAR